jgi:hypothetical protein
MTIVWQKEWLCEREKYSDLKLLKELLVNEHDDYKNYLRMNANTFGDLLHHLESYLKKKDTVMRESIPPNERLIATLRFLATDRSYLTYLPFIAMRYLNKNSNKTIA